MYIDGIDTNNIYRYENRPMETGTFIMSGSQGIDGSRYNMRILATLPDGQSIVEITDKKIYGK